VRKSVVGAVVFQETAVSDVHILELWVDHLVVKMLLLWWNEGSVKVIHRLVKVFNGDVAV
jgi:hypothetical protein